MFAHVHSRATLNPGGLALPWVDSTMASGFDWLCRFRRFERRFLLL